MRELPRARHVAFRLKHVKKSTNPVFIEKDPFLVKRYLRLERYWNFKNRKVFKSLSKSG
jgi:hypothetical protein